MKKSERIREFVRQLEPEPPAGLDPRYTGYFACFNAAQYYEAHDVLEDLWLQERSSDANFYKGLIQLAGAFVHLRKQHLRPEHPKDGRRLAPAVRLFALAEKNLGPFRPERHRLALDPVLALIHRFSTAIVASDFTRNPWAPESAPQLALQ